MSFKIIIVQHQKYFNINNFLDERYEYPKVLKRTQIKLSKLFFILKRNIVKNNF